MIDLMVVIPMLLAAFFGGFELGMSFVMRNYKPLMDRMLKLLERRDEKDNLRS